MFIQNFLMGKSRFFTCFALTALMFLVDISSANAFDFSEWDALLKKNVSSTTKDGVKLKGISYQNLKTDPNFKKVLNDLKNASLADLKSRQDKLSFWINVYNILAVKVVVDHYPVESIKDVGSIFKSVWNRPAGVVAGEERTLNDVEHEILRKMGEPRIHMAIVCASVSCPDLREEAYTPGKLEEQLDEQTRKFLANSGKGMKVAEKKNRVYLSSIFDWFEEDFESQGGVLAFVRRHAPPAQEKFFQQSDIKIRYLDYNWNLNDLPKG